MTEQHLNALRQWVQEQTSGAVVPETVSAIDIVVTRFVETVGVFLLHVNHAWLYVPLEGHEVTLDNYEDLLTNLVNPKDYSIVGISVPANLGTHLDYEAL